MSKWFTVKAEEEQVVQPLQEVKRPMPPANPTGIPDQKPMPLQELLKLIEGAMKAVLDSGMDLEKASATLLKITSLPTMSEKDRDTTLKADAIAKRIADVKKAAADIAEELKNFRKGLSGPVGETGWTEKPGA